MFLHGILMTSSSFIEEEHQIIYFSVTTIVLLIVCKRIKTNSSKILKDVLYGICALLMIRHIRSWNQGCSRKQLRNLIQWWLLAAKTIRECPNSIKSRKAHFSKKMLKGCKDFRENSGSYSADQYLKGDTPFSKNRLNHSNCQKMQRGSLVSCSFVNWVNNQRCKMKT